MLWKGSFVCYNKICLGYVQDISIPLPNNTCQEQCMQVPKLPCIVAVQCSVLTRVPHEAFFTKVLVDDIIYCINIALFFTSEIGFCVVNLTTQIDYWLGIGLQTLVPSTSGSLWVSAVREALTLPCWSQHKQSQRVKRPSFCELGSLPFRVMRRFPCSFPLLTIECRFSLS